MKKTLLAAAFLVAFGPAGAEEEVTPHEFCSNMSKMAEGAMLVRQAGVPQREVMDGIENLDVGKPIKQLNREFVAAAYKVSLRHSESGKQRTITEFGNQAYSVCVKEIAK